MSKMVTFFLFLWVGMAILGSVMQNGGGIATAELTSTLSLTGDTITVVTTAGFLAIDEVQIGSERILYSSKDSTHLYVASGGRGYSGTTATSHAAGSYCYTIEASAFNQMSGYNISKIIDATGPMAFINIPIAIFKIIINAFVVDFTFIGTDLAIITYIYSAAFIGLIVTVGLAMAGSRRV